MYASLKRIKNLEKILEQAIIVLLLNHNHVTNEW